MRSLAAALLVSTLALGLQPAMGANTQQERMKTCNDNAAQKQLAGESRKLYMKSCLAGKEEKTSSQQEKMKTCNADAGTRQLKGDARKAFMKQCLSGSASIH